MLARLAGFLETAGATGWTLARVSRSAVELGAHFAPLPGLAPPAGPGVSPRIASGSSLPLPGAAPTHPIGGHADGIPNPRNPRDENAIEVGRKEFGLSFAGEIVCNEQPLQC